MKTLFAITLAGALAACGGTASQSTAAAPGPHSLSTLHHVAVVSATADATNHDSYPFALAISPPVSYPNGPSPCRSMARSRCST